MKFRFSLYGFLKNQRYFEPFLYLAFLQKGLNFFDIGLLIGFKELASNLMEIPSGAFADIYGKRRSLQISFFAYIASFAILGSAQSLLWLYPAMFCFAIGDAFRTGTHKALILAWLKLHDRGQEKIEFYGYTRSWSQIGSAVSVLLAAILVYVQSDYNLIFFYAIIPYILGLINIAGYPSDIDKPPVQRRSLSGMLHALRDNIRLIAHRRRLRAVLVEGAVFGGLFKAGKDYLQPVLAAAAVVWMTQIMDSGALSDIQQSAFLVGPVYFLLFLFSAAASRQAKQLARLAGNPDRAAGWLWLASSGLYALMLLGAAFSQIFFIITLFVLLHIFQNFWRPLVVARIDNASSDDTGATLLSIESQARSLATLVLAPLLGFCIDTLQGPDAWRIGFSTGAIGLLLTIGFSLRAGLRILRPVRS